MKMKKNFIFDDLFRLDAVDIRPAEDRPSNHSPRSRDEERRQRRRERRQISASKDSLNVASNVSTQTPAIPHTPVRALVAERPDPSVVGLFYNPYAAGDRANQISREKPIALIPAPLTNRVDETSSDKRISNDKNIDKSLIPDRADTATNAFSPRKRQSKSLYETDQQATLRLNETKSIRNRNHDEDPLSESSANGNYKDEYFVAKRSVMNTKRILSSIHDELKTIGSTRSDDKY